VLAFKKCFLGILAVSVFILPWGMAAPPVVKVRVIVAVANIRAEAGYAGAIIAHATKGTVLEADTQQGEWYRVKILSTDKTNMISGFINISTVELIQGQPAPLNPPSLQPPAAPADSPARPAVPPAPAGPPTAYGGWTAGVGAGTMSYMTSWEYSVLEDYGRTYYHRWHLFSRTGLTGFAEKRQLLKLGPLALNLRGEVHLGFLGGTDLDLEPADAHISDGGSAFGFDVLLKLAYPIPSSSGVAFAPYFATGPQYYILSSNGVGNEFYDAEYSKGWTENVIAIPLCFGADIDFKGFSLGLEYRHVIVAYASTDLEVSGYETWFYAGQSGSAFHVHLGLRF
jgi:hypothetical protein